MPVVKPLNVVLKIDHKEIPIIGQLGAAPKAFARLEGYNAAVKEVKTFVMDELELINLLEPHLGRTGAQIAAHFTVEEAHKWIVR